MPVELTPLEPLEQQPGYDYEVDLSGQLHRIVLRYQERNDRWYLDLYDPQGALLVAGKKLSTDFPIITRYRGSYPDGELVLVDTDQVFVECGFEDLGNRCVWTFTPIAEIAEQPVSEFIVKIEKNS